MGTDLDLTGTAARCPACNAALRSDAAWCSLCHHDLRPAPTPVVIPSPSTPLYAGLDPLSAPLLDLVLPPVPPAELPAVPVQAPVPTGPVSGTASWPCTRCGTSNELTSEVCGGCGSRFLAAASELPSLVVPGVGDLQHMSRVQRVGVAMGFLALVLVPLALITFLLTGEPAKNAPSGGPTDTTVTTVTP